MSAFEEDDDETIVTSNCVFSNLSNGDTERNTHFYDSVPISGESDNTQYVPTVNTKPQRSEIHKNLENYIVRNSTDLRLGEIERSEDQNKRKNIFSTTTQEDRIGWNEVQNQLEDSNVRRNWSGV